MTKLKTLKENDFEIVKKLNKDLDIKYSMAYKIVKKVREIDKVEAINWVRYYGKFGDEVKKETAWLKMWIIKYFNISNGDLNKK